jgi:hypothetical protein
MQADSSEIASLREQIALQHQQHLQRQQAQDTKLDAMYGMMIKLQNDMTSFMAANCSSSSSGSRFLCPLGCGSDFKKVSCRCSY